MSYSALNLRPYFLRLYSSPPNIAAGPENQSVIRKSPPSPLWIDLVLKPSFKFRKGFLIELSEPKSPNPIPESYI